MNANKRSLFKYIIPLLIFLAFSVAFSYTQITPYLIKVSKIIDVDNPNYFIDLSAPDVSIKTAGGLSIGGNINTSGNIYTSGNLTTQNCLCVGGDCVNSFSGLSGIPSGYCVEFYNSSCPSGFILKENLSSGIILPQFIYKRSIIITEQSGQNLTDYQIKITLNTQSLISAGKMRSDCGDIRFTYVNSSGEYEIPYWIEDGTCNTPNTRIWVKVPEIPAAGSTTIYLYYGNSDATSQSNITDTFIFGDDFEDGIYTNKWNVVIEYYVEPYEYDINEVNGYIELYAYASSSSSKILLQLVSKTSFNLPIKLIGRWYAVDNRREMWNIIRKVEDRNYRIRTGYTYYDGISYYYYQRIATSYTERYEDTIPTSPTNFELIVSENYAAYFENGVQKNTDTTQDLFSMTDNLSEEITLFSAYNYPVRTRWEFVAVAKYTSPEPSVSVGEEQLNKAEYKVICCKQ